MVYENFGGLQAVTAMVAVTASGQILTRTSRSFAMKIDGLGATS
jgi:hypothetical protein